MAAVAAAGACPPDHWVASWLASPASGEKPGFEDQTLRLIVTPHLGGDRLRLHLSNRFGTQPLTFDTVTVARRAQGPVLVAGTLQRAAFGGRPTVTVAPGAEAVSDPVDLRFAAFDDLAVSVSVAGPSGPATEHLVGQQTSYLTPRGSGDHAADSGGSAFSAPTTTARYFLTGIDVLAPGDVTAVAAFGDSLTDGYLGSPSPMAPNLDGVDAVGRYTDALQRRMLRAPGGPHVSVVSAGITGNRILRDGVIPQHGPAGTARLRQDALDQAAVTHVIALLGINDIGGEYADADEVIAGLDNLVAQVHAARRRILLGTLPPTGGAVSVSYGDARALSLRRQVNDWIRFRSDADGVVDFDRALRDPLDPDRLNPRLDSGDRLHPNLDGYRAMAGAIDLAALRGPACGAACRRTVTLTVPRRYRAALRRATVEVGGRRVGTIRRGRWSMRVRLGERDRDRDRATLRLRLAGGRTATVVRRLPGCGRR
jgi:lysophospholipase L1-like esterase